MAKALLDYGKWIQHSGNGAYRSYKWEAKKESNRITLKGLSTTSCEFLYFIRDFERP